MSFRFTGHPFVDAGMASMAAVLEQEKKKVFKSPEELTESDARCAVRLAQDHYYYKRIKKDIKASERPLFYFLLQEVLPGSSWDQVKTGNVADMMEAKFKAHVDDLEKAAKRLPIGVCFLTGGDAHVLVSKTDVPMLSSAAERPNCYPNLNDGLPANAWMAMAVLLAPFSIEKTVKENGGGSQCLIYHTQNWRFMVGVARRNLMRLKAMLAAGCIEEFRKGYYAKFRRGTWKMALSTTLHAANCIASDDRPQVFVWSFNASNQSCHYDTTELADSFLEIHKNRRLYPAAYRDIPRCSDYVSRLILESKPIARPSVLTNGKDRKLADTTLRPGWALQRLYAEKVLKMPNRLLDKIEEAAQRLAQDAKAVNYCVFDRIHPVKLAKDFKLSGEMCAVFADSPTLWRDYLRAAVVWVSKGNSFSSRRVVASDAGDVETLIKDVAARLRTKHGYKRLAMTLSVRNPHDYRSRWIRLLSDGACTWEDFLAFNPLDEALSIGNNHRARVLRDYLIAYLLGCANQSAEEIESEEEATVSDVEAIESLTFEEIEEQEES